jgi:maleylpyruvate isomerase
MDPLVLLTDVEHATEDFLRAAAELDPGIVVRPSLLPGWTAGHVLTHVARNADIIVAQLTWARTGTGEAPVRDPEARDAAIEAGAGRPLAEQLDDIRATHERFADAAAAMPAEAWTVRLPALGLPAGALPWVRLRELEVHRVDLGAGYTAANWTDAFALRLLREVVSRADGPAMVLRPYGIDHALTIGADPGAPVVGGPTKSLAAWLTGRGDGGDLTVSPDGELPTPARWI